MQYLLNVIDEAHVQHAVGFVEHQHLNPRELQLTTLAEIEQASWSGDDNVEAAADGIDLRLKTYATKNHKRAHIYMLAVIDDALMHLRGELTSRREDECAWTLILAIKLRCGKNLQHGQTKGGGFTRAGLCAAEDVAAIQHSWDGACLDRRRYGVAFGFNGCNEFGNESQFRK